jgi:predicted acylesterase/phospholipase RssA
MNGEPPSDRFRILAVDGGGMRGVIPARVIENLERRLQAEAGPEARVADYFHMFAGTSTGGLVALSLTVPAAPGQRRPKISASDLAGLYTRDGKRIFHRSLWHKLWTLWGWRRPKYSLGPLEDAVKENLGADARLADALRELVVVAYDMTDREPYFFKRWPAREDESRNCPVVDAALATAAAPTYFPSHEVDGHALVDGGVLAANPTLAAVVEALKRRTDEPTHLSTDDLFAVSIGAGLHETEYSQAEVSRWGKLGWILPQDGEPPILATVLGGASDGVDHWVHTLLNGPPPPHSTRETIGRGPGFYRLQVNLDPPIEMDRPEELPALEAAAKRLIAEREKELLAAGTIPPDSASPGAGD